MYWSHRCHSLRFESCFLPCWRGPTAAKDSRTFWVSLSLFFAMLLQRLTRFLLTGVGSDGITYLYPQWCRSPPRCAFGRLPLTREPSAARRVVTSARISLSLRSQLEGLKFQNRDSLPLRTCLTLLGLETNRKHPLVDFQGGGGGTTWGERTKIFPLCDFGSPRETIGFSTVGLTQRIKLGYQINPSSAFLY